MAKRGINGTDTMACIDSGVGRCILKSAWVDGMKVLRVKWMGMPVKFSNGIKCRTEARNIIV